MSDSDASINEEATVVADQSPKGAESGTDDSSADSSRSNKSSSSSNNSVKRVLNEVSSSESSGSESGDDNSTSSEASFETVKDTTAKLDLDSSIVAEIVIKLDPPEARSKSASPSKVGTKQGQGRASSSPMLKTPSKNALSPKTTAKKAAPSVTAKSTPTETPVEQVEGKSPRKPSTSSAITKSKTPPANDKMDIDDHVQKSKEVKNELTPKSTRKRSRSRGSVADDQSKAKVKPEVKNAKKSDPPVKTSKNDRDSVVVTVDKPVKNKKEEKTAKTTKERHDSGKKTKKQKSTNSPVKKRKHSSSSVASESEVPGTSARIQKVPTGRRFQRYAISRAKLVGLIKDGQIRILQITEALKIIDHVKFSVLPTQVCRNYYKCPGTGLPHIRRHLRNWQIKYGKLIANVAKLHLKMALAAEKRKLELMSPEASNEFNLVWQFESDVKHVEAARPRASTSASFSGMVPEPSPPSKKLKTEVGTESRSRKKKKKSKGDSDTSEKGTPKSSKKRSKSNKVKKEAKTKKAKD